MSTTKKTIAVGTVVVNVAEIFWSPLRGTDDITHHRNIGTLGPETIELFRGLPLRHTPEEGAGFEAVSVLVVKHDNLGKNLTPPLGAPTPRPPTLVSTLPAPQVGDPLHYATMIQRICTAYQDRWA